MGGGQNGARLDELLYGLAEVGWNADTVTHTGDGIGLRDASGER